MKKLMTCFIVGMFVVPFLVAAGTQEQSGSVTLEVMNPRSDLEPPPIFPLTPRVQELSGKKVGIYWLGKAGGDNFFDAFERVLKEKYPTVTPIRYRGRLDIGDQMAKQVAGEVDTLVYGVGD